MRTLRQLLPSMGAVLVALAPPLQPLPCAPLGQEVAPGEEGWTIERVRARMAALEADPAIGADVAGEALELLQAAVAELEHEGALRARAAEYAQALESAPPRTEEIRAAIATLADQPLPDASILPAGADLAELDRLVEQARADVATAREELATLEGRSSAVEGRRDLAPSARAEFLGPQMKT